MISITLEETGWTWSEYQLGAGEVYLNNGEGALTIHLQALRSFEEPGKKFSLDSEAEVSDPCVDDGWR